MKLLLSAADGPFRKEVTHETLGDFSWETINSSMAENAPLTLTVLEAMFPVPEKIKGQHRVLDEERR